MYNIAFCIWSVLSFNEKLYKSYIIIIVSALLVVLFSSLISLQTS
jgi:hypothetical protein